MKNLVTLVPIYPCVHRVSLCLSRLPSLRFYLPLFSPPFLSPFIPFTCDAFEVIRVNYRIRKYRFIVASQVTSSTIDHENSSHPKSISPKSTSAALYPPAPSISSIFALHSFYVIRFYPIHFLFFTTKPTHLFLRLSRIFYLFSISILKYKVSTLPFIHTPKILSPLSITNYII